VSPARSVPSNIARPPYAPDAPALVPAVPPDEIPERMRAAGRAAREVLLEVAQAVRPGVTGDELDRVCHEACIARGGYPSPLHYKGFPKSLCTSVNEIICHGIPDDRPLANGDIVDCDVTIYLHGVHGDHNETFLVGEVDDRGSELVMVTNEAMWKGIEAVRPGAHVFDIGRAIQEHAESHDFGVVRAFVGHGIGTEFHTAPSIPHYFDRYADTVLEPGMLFTIEPMITEGSWELGRIWPDGWTAPTRDGSRCAQFEHTMLVTGTGVEVLTLLPDEPRQPESAASYQLARR
jgi:methionyl aminopeptidase